MKTNDTALNERDLKFKKRLFTLVLYIVYPAYILHSCVISPLYTITDSNVAYKGIVSLLLRFTYEIIDLFVIFFSLSILIYGLCRLKNKDMRSTIALVLLAPIFKYVLKIAVSPFVDGFVSFDQFIEDIFTLATSGALEILQLLLILFLANKGIKRYRERSKIVAKASETLGKSVVPGEDLLPFEKVLGTKNPLQNGALISSIVVVAVRIVMHLINDLSTISYISFNMLFLLPYVLSLVVGVLGYLLMLYTFINIAQQDE